MSHIGVRIKKMREAQNLTIDQVAKITGVPSTRLAYFEKGEEVPSIGMVIKLSRVLGSRVGHILHDRGVKPDIFSVLDWGQFEPTERTGGPPRDSDQGYHYESMLRPGMVGQSMEPFLLTFEPEAAAEVEPIAHEGEEFIHVLEGEVELTYGEEIYTLRKGATAYLDSSKPHAFRGVGEVKPKVIAVIFSKD